MTVLTPGARAVARKGWLAAHGFLLARRACQLGILGLFLLGPLAGIWLIKGNLASSLTLDVVPLTDPYVLLQSALAGHELAGSALIGAAIVAGFYLLVGGRVYCAWVCPMNLVTDTAGWLRRRLGLHGGREPSRQLRYLLLAGTLIAAVVSGSIAWELINPVSMLQRGLLFGAGFMWLVVLAIFAYDLAVAPRGWCGHVCPVGAFYSLLGHGALARVSAQGRARCDDCMDCYAACPEPQVIGPALKGAGCPVIRAAQCTNCARCVDVCSERVFRIVWRFDHRVDEKREAA